MAKGLALYRSLLRNARPFTLHVLCLDAFTLAFLADLNLPAMSLYSLEEIEQYDPGLSKVRTTRSLLEYYFTCSPILPRFLFEKHPGIELLTYLDADLYFFSSPTPLFNELGQSSLLVVPRRPFKHEDKAYGTFGVGLIIFRNDEEGRRCLDWWRERCLDWCYDECRDGRYADQKYLDEWPARFRGLVVSEHKGAGLAPGNVAGVKVHLKGNMVMVDNDPLIFFHFSDLHAVSSHIFHHDHSDHRFKFTRTLLDSVYTPYCRELGAVIKDLHAPALPSLRDGGRTMSMDTLRRVLNRRRLFVLGPTVTQFHLEQVGRLLGALRRFSKPDPAGRGLYGLLWRFLRRVELLRSSLYLLIEAKKILLDFAPPKREFFDRIYRHSNPWDDSSEKSQEIFHREAKMLDEMSAGSHFHIALEVGCAEGTFTEMLAQRCRSLVAVDVSSTALARARNRRVWRSGIKFQVWDLRREPMPGSFDLIAVSGVLEYFDGPFALSRARGKLIGGLKPQGYLLVQTSRANPVVESSWWGRRLHRGKWINEFIAKHRDLKVISSYSSQSYVLTLFQRVSTGD